MTSILAKGDKLIDISIHMPHAGHDRIWMYQDMLKNISIHMPHAGHDFIVRRRYPKETISIHMPHAGHDNALTKYKITDDSISCGA